MYYGHRAVLGQGGSMKTIVNKEFISTYVLHAVIDKVQELMLISKASGGDIDPTHALKELQEGLAEASELARELSPRNFAPEAIEPRRKR
jgi:hypothetical protein